LDVEHIGVIARDRGLFDVMEGQAAEAGLETGSIASWFSLFTSDVNRRAGDYSIRLVIWGGDISRQIAPAAGQGVEPIHCS
jgi:hypothetical protein